MSSHTPPSSNGPAMKQNGEVVFGKRNRTKTKRFQDELTTIPYDTRRRWKAQEKKKKSNSTSSSKSQKIKTFSKPKRRKGKKQSPTTKEAKKKIPKGEYEVFTDSEELKVKSSKVNSSKSKKVKRKRRKQSDDSSSLNNPGSKASISLKKKQREESKQKTATLNKLRGCFSSENERSEKKKLMDLMTFLEGSTQSQLKERRDDMRSKQTEDKEEMTLNKEEVKDRFAMICEDFIDGNHPTKILHKSWNEQFVQIMGSISYQPLRRQQMVLNLLTSADLTDDQRVKVFNALETNTIRKLPFLEMTEDLLPSCNPLEFDPDSLMKKADLKLRHNGISKSWNLITSSSTPNHQFTKEEIMEYIDGDEDFDFLEIYKGFYEFDNFSPIFDFFFLC